MRSPGDSLTGVPPESQTVTEHSQQAVLGAVAVTATAVLCTGVIALGFLMPERLFESSLGLVAFFVAGVVMVGCAIVANLYDLRGILADAYG